MQMERSLTWSPDSAIFDCMVTPRARFCNNGRPTPAEPRGLLLKRSSPLTKKQSMYSPRTGIPSEQATPGTKNITSYLLEGKPVNCSMTWGQMATSPVSRNLHSCGNDSDPDYVQVKMSMDEGFELPPLDSPPSTPRGMTSRKEQRDSRPRPWTNFAKTRQKPELERVETHYEDCLPKDKWMNMRTMKYAKNPRWGQAFQIRRHPTSSKPFKPETEEWLMENDFRIWLLEKSKSTKLELTFGPDGPFIMSDKKLNGRRRVDKIGGHKDLYEQFHSEKLLKNKQQRAAIMIQKHIRGWLVRKKMKQLRNQTYLYHGDTWQKFTKEYKSLVNRVQKRHGKDKPKSKFNLDQMETYMDKKLKYEKAFRKVAIGDKLPRDQLMKFFNECGLHPRESDIEKAFQSVFKGCGSRAEVVLMVDCNAGKSVQQSKLQKCFMKETVQSLDISPNGVRVSIVPFNSKSMESFSLGAFSNKEDILQAIDTMEFSHGSYHADVSLRHMRDVMGDARQGVPKTCIVITDGQSKVNYHAEKEAKLAREQDIAMFVVGVGQASENRDLLALASSPDHVYKMTDFYAVNKIKEEIMRKVCLKNCAYCHGHTTDEDPFHYLVYNPHTHKIEDVRLQQQNSSKSIHQDSKEHSKNNNRKRNIGRGLLQNEAMELLWTLFPPGATSLPPLHRSTWMRPIVDGEQYVDLPESHNDAEFDKCLEIVLKSKLDRQGSIVMPVGDYDVEEVKDYETAYKHARDYIKRERLMQDVHRQKHDMLNGMLDRDTNDVIGASESKHKQIDSIGHTRLADKKEPCRRHGYSDKTY